MTMSTSSIRWQILLSRDRSLSYDNFVYAVKTTKIYCRPSCPSRLPRRANVIFYDSSIQAENAGYRACKRCKPQLSNHLLVDGDSPKLIESPTVEFIDYPQHKKLIAKACQSIILNKGPKRLKDLANESGLTSCHFHRTFKRITGMTPRKYGLMVITKISNRDLENVDFNINIENSFGLHPSHFDMESESFDNLFESFLNVDLFNDSIY